MDPHMNHHNMGHHDMAHVNHSGHMMSSDPVEDYSMHMNHDNHSAHASMNHDDMGGGGGHMMHMMSMTFHFGCTEKILFDTWSISSVDGLIGSMVGIFALALLYEGLKYFREYLFWRTYNSLQYSSVQMPVNKNLPDCNRVVHVVGEVVHKQPPSMLSINHAFQTVLHIVQMTMSYFLMLIFMTYNVWLCIAVVLGAAAGYFLFGWKKSVVVDVTEHCH